MTAARSAPIEERLHEGQEVVVQVLKEPLGTKGARITSHVSLPGPLPRAHAHRRARRGLAQDHRRGRAPPPEDDPQGVPPGARRRRADRADRGPGPRGRGLPARRRATCRGPGTRCAPWPSRHRAPVLLYREPSLLERLLRDLLSEEVASIRLDSEREFQRTLELVRALEPALAPAGPAATTGPAGIMEEHGVSAELERALRSKVWLPSGGYIVINQTEALVAIDVNTGRFVGQDPARGDAAQGQPRRGARDRAPDPPARPRRHHRGGLHRHGGAQEPARGDARARAGAAQGPLADQAALGERVRPRDPDPQAGQAVARAAAACSPAPTARAAGR